jgi:hypothetical protein
MVKRLQGKDLNPDPSLKILQKNKILRPETINLLKVKQNLF